MKELKTIPGDHTTDLQKFFRELFGLFLLFWAFFLCLSLLTFDAADPSINVVKSGQHEVQNLGGLFGAYASGMLNDIFGVGAIFWPFIFAFLGITYVSARFSMHWWRWCGFFLLALSVLTGASSLDVALGDLSGGGFVGSTLYRESRHWLSPAGSILLWGFITLIGLQLALNISWFNLAGRLTGWVRERVKGTWQIRLPQIAPLWHDYLAKFKTVIKSASPERLVKKFSNIKISRLPPAPPLPLEMAPDIAPLPAPKPQEEMAPEWHIDAPEPAGTGHEDRELPVDKMPEPRGITLPSLDLLRPAQPSAMDSPEDMENKGRALMKCFEDFDVKGTLVRVTPGPVVTMFEMRPAPGIRVSKIANLSNDLSLALKAVAVRIQAPIPGTDTVGIEVPNGHREMVNFRELALSPAFQDSPGPLAMILGKDIAGRPYVAELSKMPHLLVAGATGAGKSVCLNCILASLLFRNEPKDLRFLLVDPKQVEMEVYKDIPHLVHPVVTDMNDAKNALAWATQEMEHRFSLFPRLGARNLATYNQRLALMGDDRQDEYADLEHIPYIVIVIDELNDLLMTAAREAESSIVRLAQLARAAGIHMILATQRPSAKVVTPMIKSNLLNRISFQVSSQYDSRVILDQGGAEYLLGKGDMLYKSSGGRLLRLHGPFLSDEEVQAIAAHWKSQGSPEYGIDFSSWNEEQSSDSPSRGKAVSDPKYAEAKAFILEQGYVSISLLQRHLGIGYNRSANLIEQFEREGLIGKADGSKPRKVIRKD